MLSCFFLEYFRYFHEIQHHHHLITWTDNDSMMNGLHWQKCHIMNNSYSGRYLSWSIVIHYIVSGVCTLNVHVAWIPFVSVGFTPICLQCCNQNELSPGHFSASIRQTHAEREKRTRTILLKYQSYSSWMFEEWYSFEKSFVLQYYTVTTAAATASTKQI